MQKHLLYHCYPRACHPHWRRSVEHLCARWDQFTGRRIVSVAYDTGTDTPDMVREAFGPCEVEIRAVRNSPLQEIESFPHLLHEVSREPGYTFYCHSKGCTHCRHDSASHIWCDAMAEACLDYPELVDCALSEFDTCGAFRSRQVIGDWRTSPPWHFAGTWYWFRNDAIFNRDWLPPDNVLWGAETWPGRKFAIERSHCLFFDHAETLHLYDTEFWSRAVTPGLANWRRALAKSGLRPIQRPGFSPSTRRELVPHPAPDHNTTAFPDTRASTP